MHRPAKRDRDSKLLGHILAARESFGVTIALFAIATGGLLWQVLGQIGITLIGQDSSFTLWSFWLPSCALWLNQDVMITDYSAFPFQQNLLLVLSPLGSLLYFGLRGLRLSPPLAFNLLYGVSVIFTGWTTAAYLRYFGLPKAGSLFAGVLLVFSPVMHYQLSHGHPDLMALGWIPLGCLVWEQVRSRQRHSVWLALVWVGTVLTSVPLTLLALVVWLPYITVSILQTREEERHWLINSMLVQVLVWVAVCMTYPLPGLFKTWVGLAPPAEATALLTNVWQLTVATGFIGLVWVALAVLAIASLWRDTFVQTKHSQATRSAPPVDRTIAGFWLGMGLLSLLLALIPAGSGWFSTHQQWLSPADWIALASVSFCLLIAFGLASVWQRWELGDHRVRVLAMMPLVVLVVTIALRPAPPTVAWRPSPAYTAIGKEPGDYALLEVPFGIHSLTNGRQFGSGFDLQQYAVIHRKRTLNGNIAGSGTDAFNTDTHSLLLRALAGQPFVPTASITAELQTLVQSQQIGYVVVQLARLQPGQQTQIFGLFDTKTSGLCRVFRDSSTVVYRTKWHPFDCNQPLMLVNSP